MKQILYLTPVLREMLWGGRRLAEFGYDLPQGNIGECWGVSAHEKGDCTVRGGRYDGKKLSELWHEEPELFGGGPAVYGDFPLLIKIIDAQDDLSIQVHPDDAYAKEHENGACGKTECWYVLDAAPGAGIVIGHNAKKAEELRSMVTEGRFRELIREVPVKKGDFFQIEPGTVHAIKKGTLLLETQESSDVTYRLYDYDRLQNGVKRPLHIDKSLDVIRVPNITGNYHTDFAAKGRAAVEAFRNGYEFVYIHVEAPDECGHHGEMKEKIWSIEQIDEKIMGPVLDYLRAPGEPWAALVMPDHPTPLAKLTHTGDPVPFALLRSDDERPGARRFTESAAAEAGLFLDPACRIMERLVAERPLEF